MNTTLLVAAVLTLGADVPERQTVITVVGTAGTDEYGQQFQEWAKRWESSTEEADATYISIGAESSSDVMDRDRLCQQLEQLASDANEPLWIVLIGHGTFDGRVAKFNMRGPDITAEELASWLKPINRPTAIVNCASASGPFINKLAGRNRVVVTATKSGFEHNFARFGDFISNAISDTQFDLDKDDQTSLLEAFIAASSQVEEFYSDEGRLATEHALIDDNGDAKGTPADWFRGVRSTKSAKDGVVDGQLANRICLVQSPQEASLTSEMRSRRDEIEAKVELLRSKKKQMPEDVYYAELETLVVALSELYETTGEPNESPALR